MANLKKIIVDVHAGLVLVLVLGFVTPETVRRGNL
jgi:hypothetical protein